MATRSDEVAPGRNPGASRILLVLVGVLVLLGLVWFLFLRGGPAEELEVLPAPVITEAPTDEATEDPPRRGRKGPIETFEVFAPKDPFRPVISEAAGTGTAPGVAGDAPAPAASPGDDSETGTGAPSGGSDIGSGGSSGGGGSSVGGHRVRLIDTFNSGGETRARVQVDGTVYTVSEGDRFAENFELLSVNGQCASMLYGDDQFSLCEGEEILK